MREAFGDLWELAESGFADALVITTNGDVNSKGRAVMGRGCALQAAQRYPEIPSVLAEALHAHGNHAFVLSQQVSPGYFMIVSMPVKHHWHEQADPALIVQSAHELMAIADAHRWKSVVMPRPGCGNGRLKWDDVRPLLERILDNRFTVVTYG